MQFVSWPRIVIIMRQSRDFWRAYSLFLARWGANDTTMGTNKLYSRQKSCDYHCFHTQGQIVEIYFVREDCLNMKSLCRLQIPFTAQPFSADKLGYFTQTVYIDKDLFLGNSLDLHSASLTARNKISFDGCALNY